MDILINLLPPSKKGEIKNLRMVGIVLKIGLVSVCAMCVFLAFLFFTNKMIKIQEEAVAKEIAKFEQSQSYQEVKQAQDILRDYSKFSAKVKSGLGKQDTHWALISKINEIVPADIKLEMFSVDAEGILTLKGVAYHRGALLELKSGLEACDYLSKLESPISNFISDKDVEFEFTAEIK